MARILNSTRGGKHHVSIRGPFSFKDLRRLERACGAALEEARIALEIHLEGVTRMDEHARIYLDRLARRGAVISNRHS